ncbi:MAG: phosphocholine cytidylyltransferase family protein [Candidatus Omnitrophota bacterium]
MKAIILAAGEGKRLRGYTNDPKCLAEVNKEALIVRMIKMLKECGVRNIVIVVGYKAKKVIDKVKKHRLKVSFINNDDFGEGSILSLWRAREHLNGSTLLIDSDTYFERDVIETVFRSKKQNFFLIDQKSGNDDEAVRVGFTNGRAVRLARGLSGDYGILGEWAGVTKFSLPGSRRLKALLEKKIIAGERQAGYEFIIPDLFKSMTISYELIDGLKWVEIDFPKDLKKAKSLNID